MDDIKTNLELQSLIEEKNKLSSDYKSEIDYGKAFCKKIETMDIPDLKRRELLSNFRKENPVFDKYVRLRWHIRCLKEEVEENHKHM